MDMTLTDLEVGDFVDYFMQSWEVKEISSYDWGNNDFSIEYRLNNGKDTLYVSVSESDGEDISVSTPRELWDIKPDIRKHFREHSDPVTSIELKGKTYELHEESQGHFADRQERDQESAWQPFVSFDYFDQKRENSISIVQLGNYTFEAYTVAQAKSYEFSNFVPANQND